MYKNINPFIKDDFNRTFNTSFYLPKLGLGIGGALFVFATLSNFSVPSRIALVGFPTFIDFIRTSRDVKS